MISDIRERDDGSVMEADVAIIGGGAAAIVMARRLIGSGKKVLVLESGGFDFDDGPQDLFSGSTTGAPYFELDQSRYRMLGGSTYRWGARTAPFKNIDMEPRNWLNLPGWPIGPSALTPYAQDITELLNLNEGFDYDNVDWDEFTVTPPKIDAEKLDFTAFQFGKNILLGEVCREDLKNAKNVEVFLYASVTKIVANRTSDHIEHLEIATLQGKKFTAKADKYVLATGGIENARLLLLSGDDGLGLANGSDCVGRYFMEHPTVSAGIVHSNEPQKLHDVFSPGLVGGRLVEIGIAPNPKVMERENMYNIYASTRLNVAADATQAMREILWNFRHRNMPRSLSWYRKNTWLTERLGIILRDPFSIVGNLVRHAFGRPKRFRFDSLRLELRSEQSPNPNSRVTLSDAVDGLGQRRAHLHWDLTEVDRQTMQAMATLVDSELRRLEIGHLEIAEWLQGDDVVWPDDLVGGHHHMGTTRMSASASDGVVNADCKCHDIDNLYIAGSSVFPSASYVNPTMTLLGLSMRLADHLMDEIA